MNDRTAIPLSRGKLILILLAALAYHSPVAYGCSCWMTRPSTSSARSAIRCFSAGWRWPRRCSAPLVWSSSAERCSTSGRASSSRRKDHRQLQWCGRGVHPLGRHHRDSAVEMRGTKLIVIMVADPEKFPAASRRGAARGLQSQRRPGGQPHFDQLQHPRHVPSPSCGSCSSVTARSICRHSTWREFGESVGGVVPAGLQLGEGDQQRPRILRIGLAAGARHVHQRIVGGAEVRAGHEHAQQGFAHLRQHGVHIARGLHRTADDEIAVARAPVSGEPLRPRGFLRGIDDLGGFDA